MHLTSKLNVTFLKENWLRTLLKILFIKSHRTEKVTVGGQKALYGSNFRADFHIELICYN